ncbi:uncharacterized protein LOC123873270 isoform X2 [Maniola jurtina]|uniref:uncharacterized protein LOC123873270 isoform X2 n=1 Tax=Maniola jurtina TaxID=191418 RepID=UPI001E68D7D6|nr:uncharacterized protein LOC123873270 isoform X2 [Maniola jurtina]
MTLLDDLPHVTSFFGADLKTGSMIVAALGVLHPMAYGCTAFISLSYLLVTIWILVALFFAASVVLFCGIVQNDALFCTIWIWYALIFVVLMLMMMTLLAIVFTSRQQRTRVIFVILGIVCNNIFHSRSKQSSEGIELQKVI